MPILAKECGGVPFGSVWEYTFRVCECHYLDRAPGFVYCFSLVRVPANPVSFRRFLGPKRR